MSVDRLNTVLSLINVPSLTRLDRYYRGDQPMAFLSADIKAQLGDRLPEMVLNVPRVVVGAIEERLDVEGFRMGRNGPADETLLDIWQANDLDEWSQLCHIEALKHGISFVTVWWDPDGGELPRIAVESAHQMAVEYEPGTRTVAAAAKRWEEKDALGRAVTRAVLYLPDTIQHYSKPGSPNVQGFGSGWVLDRVDANPLGEVPVVPFVNRPSLTDLSGESELADVISLTDGINKLLSDMLVTSEYHAEPRRYATGIQVPRDVQGDERLRAKVKRDWQDATAGKFLLGGTGVGFGQFTAADLQNFIGGVNLLLGKAAFISGLAPHMMGITTDNPASAEAIRSSESPLIRRVRRKMRQFGGSWERVMRLALKVMGRLPADGAYRLETIWANPETQTFAQDADAVTKLVGGDRPVIDLQSAREILRFSPTQIRRMDDAERARASTTATADVEARMEQARRLQAEDGLSQQAALAAVGLLAAASAQAGSPATPSQPPQVGG